MSMRLPARWLFALGLCACMGCSAQALERGVQHYENERFAEALATLEPLPARARLSQSDWVRYALYRGLTELALGNAPAAHHWLLRTRLALDRHARLLDRHDRARLEVAWRSLGLLPAQR